MKDKVLLHRQIHPSYVLNDIVSHQAFLENEIKISSEAFNPTDKDEDKLSVYNGDKFSSKDAYDHYTRTYETYGVMSVTVEEVHSIDPLTATEDNSPFNGHVYIDFSGCSSRNQKKEKSWKIKRLRGKQKLVL